MRTIIKKFTFLLIVIFNHTSFSQEKIITTKFNKNGTLYENADAASVAITTFIEEENCIVLNYLGRYIYNIKYKEWVGFVKDEFLIVNEDMMNLFFANEEKQKLQAIASKNKRQNKISQIIIEDDQKLKKTNPVSKFKADKKKIELEAPKHFKKNQKLRKEQERQDSIQKIRNAEMKQTQSIIVLKRKQEKVTKQNTQGSKSKTLEKFRNQKIESDRSETFKGNQKTKDSIKKLKDNAASHIITNKNSEEKEQLATQKREDSLAQVNTIKKLNDSIKKVKEEEKKQLEILRISARKQDQLLAQQKKQDSIAAIKEKKPEILEDIKYRTTCHYIINEYDQYYGRQLKITDKYVIAKNLNIELIKEGNTVKINLNTNEDLGCASYVPNTRSSVSITLINDKVITLYHTGSLDCNDFSLKAQLPPFKMALLKYSPIKSIHFRGTKGSLTISDIDYKFFFMDKLKCIE